MPSDKVPASLSSISVPRKPSPVTTDYINPRLEIVGPEYRNTMFIEADRFKKLANYCLDMDKACRNYFSGRGKIFFMKLFRVSYFINK